MTYAVRKVEDAIVEFNSEATSLRGLLHKIVRSVLEDAAKALNAERRTVSNEDEQVFDDIDEAYDDGIVQAIKLLRAFADEPVGPTNQGGCDG